MKWLSIPIGAKAAALGGAFTAMTNDVNSIFWNPAGLGFSEGRQVFLTQTQWIADINVNAAAISYNADAWGIFGASLIQVDWGQINGTRRADNEQGFVETGTFEPKNWGIGISYARRVSQAFSFGANLKYLYEYLGASLEGSFDSPSRYKAEMNVLAFDFGTIYDTGFRGLKIGMALFNFSKEQIYRAEYFPLPLTFKFGLAMDVTRLWREESQHKITLAVDALHLRDYSERLNFGLEYNFKDMVFLRGGYKSNYDEEDLSLGAGIAYSIESITLGVDYSYVNFKHFDAVHMFSIGFMF